jgi:hypothetical protein
LAKKFWYEKQRKAGKFDTISGEIVYPNFVGSSKYPQMKTNFKQSMAFTIKQLRIDGCQFKLTENQIRCWVHLFGEIEGELEEEMN